MRIVIDARLYSPQVAKGLGRYVQEVVNGLRSIDHDHQYIILLGKESYSSFIASENFQKVLAPWRWYTLAEQIHLPRLLKRLEPDLVHFPHFNVPLLYRGKFIVTIHDLLLRHHHSRRATLLGPFLFWLKKLMYRLVVASAVRRTVKIIAVSEFTKSEIRRFYPRAVDKTAMIYEGVTALSPAINADDDNRLLLRYNVSTPFILYVGNCYPHKNLATALEAWRLICQQWAGSWLIVGRPDYFSQRLEREARRRGFDETAVQFVGYVPDSDLGAFYRQASCYLFPSLYEGFGLPPLEAMSHGTPVACSDIPCLREICGPAAAYFTPTDPASMAAVVTTLVTDQAVATRLRTAGPPWARRYSWLDCVRSHHDLYLHATSQQNQQQKDSSHLGTRG